MTGDRPENTDTFLLAVGTQFPDLVDKPLAWWFGILPSGLSLAHSLLFAVPVCIAAIVISRRRNRSKLGEAFAIGYLSHPFSDLGYALLTGGTFAYEFLFWPLLSHDPSAGDTTFLIKVSYFLQQFQQFLATPRGKLYLLFDGILLCGVLLLWARDGFPGPGLFRRLLTERTDKSEKQQ